MGLQAIPKKGRLHDKIKELLKGSGIEFAPAAPRVKKSQGQFEGEAEGAVPTKRARSDSRLACVFSLVCSRQVHASGARGHRALHQPAALAGLLARRGHRHLRRRRRATGAEISLGIQILEREKRLRRASHTHTPHVGDAQTRLIRRRGSRHHGRGHRLGERSGRGGAPQRPTTVSI